MDFCGYELNQTVQYLTARGKYSAKIEEIQCINSFTTHGVSTKYRFCLRLDNGLNTLVTDVPKMSLDRHNN